VARQPDVVVVDSRLQTPGDAALFRPGRKTVIYSAVADAPAQAVLEARGATVVHLPGPGGKVDLAAMLADLARREVNELHVEAGHKLNGSLVRAGLVDEFLVYLAPKLLGQGRGMVQLGALTALQDGIDLDISGVERIGADLRLLATVRGHDSF